MKFPLMTIVLILAFSASIHAAVPNTMNYQGRLTDDQGQPLTGTVSMTFTIYDAETDGNLKWTETHPSVSVVNGIFSVVLGQGNPPVPIEDTVFSDHDRWLEIVVEGETITPRTRLASSPYAHQAGWMLADSVLYTAGEYGIAKAGDTLYGDWDFTHVNLGITSTTGTEEVDHVYCTVSGGYRNTASGNDATVGGGYHNTASGFISTVGGGYQNTASWTDATVGGGQFNEASGYASTVGGGYQNTASGDYATIGGGIGTASGYASSVGGGYSNTASGYASTVPGGYSCTASGRYSFAAGCQAKANHDGTFVWADSTFADFASTGRNQFLIRASGGVGIGTTAPLSPLQVELQDNWRWDVGNGWGDFNVGDGTYGLSVGVATGGGGSGDVRIWTGAGAAARLIFANSTYGDNVTILGTGEVGIGTTSPSEELHVIGDICYTGSIGACSDARYKKDVKTITGALERLNRLRGVNFRWKQGEYPAQKFDDKPQLGLIAQEVKEVFPELVMQDNEGYYSVDYVKLTPVLVEGVKELKSENDELKARLTQLESLMESISAQQDGN